MLPSQEDMMEDVEAFYSSLEASSTPKPYTHCVGNNLVEYKNWLAGQCGGLAYEEWRISMCCAAFKSRVTQPMSYRDDWEDQHLVLQAHEDFIKQTSNEVRDRCVSQ
ncbi:hypothetical protein SO802_026309 [Lithocarpus litseifolius]|uniref:Uncharacterized protein n=1 Tax=Lithocarpus litseifolius TaxID=425828 RepID=A0AAW2C2W0_9ROSI